MTRAEKLLTILTSVASVLLLVGAIVAALGPTSASHSRATTSASTDTDVKQDADHSPKPGDAEGNETTSSAEANENTADTHGGTVSPPSSKVETDTAETVIPPGPWSKTLAADTPATPFDEIAFERFDIKKFLPTVSDLNEWLEPLPDQPHAIHPVHINQGNVVGFRGVMKLKSPWPRGAALRISLSNVERFTLHVYNGTEGLAFSAHPRLRDACIAYATTRDLGKALPKTHVLLATDGDRCRRTEFRLGGPLLIRHHEDELIVTRGDILVLRVPCPFEIKEAFVSGGAPVLGIQMLRVTGEVPAPKSHPVVTSVDKPAELAWEEKLGEGATFERLADGSVRLTANKAKQRGFVVAPVPRTGIHEFIFEIEGASVGAGVFVGMTKDQPRTVIRFMQNTSDQRLCLSAHGHDDSRQVGLGSPTDRIVPSCATRCFVKIVYGCGSVRWWMSADGVNWAEPTEPVNNLDSQVTHFGLHHIGQYPNCQLTLKSVQLRELTAVTSLADPQLVPLALAVTEKLKPEDRQAKIAKAREEAKGIPEGTTDVEWFRACVIRSLAAGTLRDTIMPMMSELLDDTLERTDLSLQQKVDALSEASLLLDLRDNNAWVLEHLKRVQDVGRRAIAAGDAHSFELVHRTLMTMPIKTRYNTFVVGDIDFLRYALLHRAYSKDFEDALELSSRLRFFGQHQKLTLLPWFEAVTARELDRAEVNGSAIRQNAEWQPQWIEQLDKHAYNTMAEIYSLAESESFEDAATMISNVDADSLSGLAPTRDPMLVSAPAPAIKSLVKRYEAIASAISDKHEGLAELRIRHAIQRQDRSAIELAVVQFAGTTSAGDAHDWLGDDALANGWFEVAVDHYTHALAVAGPTRRAGLHARRRLAGALAGEEIGEPVTTPVSFHDATYSPQDFEKLVQSSLQESLTSRRGVGPVDIAVALPEPCDFDVHKRSRLDGEIGQSPNAQVSRGTTTLGVDWAGEQVSILLDNDRTLISNRFQIAAYQLTDGKRLWQSEKPPGSIRKSQEWTLIRMKPTIVGDRIYARLMYGEGPTLSCFNAEDGKRIWTTPMPRGYMFVSDPQWIQGQLVGLVGHRDEQANWLIELVHVNPQTGLLDQELPLIELRTSWETRHACELAQVDGDIVAALGGVVLRTDTRANIAWLRRQTVVPASSDENWVQQSFQSPILDNGRLYVTQPGVRTIQCLDAETGSQVWQRVVPDIRRVISQHDGQLIAQTGRQLIAINANDGKHQWSSASHQFLTANTADDRFILAMTRFDSDKKRKRFKPQLVWFDRKTGQQLDTRVLDLFEDTDGWAGPMFAHGENLWLFSGRGKHEANRDFVQLVPKK